MKLAELAYYDRLVALFAGKSGSGKSVATASLAKRYLKDKKRLKIYDIDRRARGILGAASALGQDVLDAIEIDQDIDVEKGFTGLEKKLEIDLIKAKTSDCPYGGIVIDSASTLENMFLRDSQILKGNKGQKRAIGTVNFIQPDDYLYAAMAFRQLYDNFINRLGKVDFILSGWIVDVYGKDPTNEFANNIVVGQKILCTDKLSQSIPGTFDEVYLFEKEETGSSNTPLKYTVTFESYLAKTSREALRNQGKVDLTGKCFMDVYDNLVKPKEAIANVNK